MEDQTNRWRIKRGKLLASYVKNLATRYGRKITVLDVGGRALYWGNVDTSYIKSIVLLNNCSDELATPDPNLFIAEMGDGCAVDHPDKSFDLVHSNSVIEHVGNWRMMQSFASETMRVGGAGWVQTPAWEFPIEPHFKLPFVHWLAAPVRRSALRLAPDYCTAPFCERREHADRVNLLSRSEVKTLFPGAEILTERFALLPKSYMVKW